MSVSKAPSPPDPPDPLAPPVTAAPRVVLHPILANDALFLWAELAVGATAPGREAWSPPYAYPRVPAHPRALRPSALSARLQSVPGPLGAAAALGQSGARQLDLPSAPRAPLPSPSAGGDPAAAGEPRSWAVPALRLGVGEAAGLLVPLRWDEADAALRPGPAWLLCWRLAAVVRACVRRGAVVPTLTDPPNGARENRWRPVWSRQERAELLALAHAAPEAALGEPEYARHALEAFSWAYADALVRTVAGRCPDLAAWRRVPRQERNPARFWLADLLVAAPRRAKLAGVAGSITRLLADPARADGPGKLVLRLDEPALDEPAGDESEAAEGAAGAERSDAPAAPAATDRVAAAADPGAASAGEPPSWPLSIYLEPAGEPGALVPAEQVWDEGTGPEALLPGGAASLEDALERAATILPALERAADVQSGTIDLDTAEAWALLEHGRARLEAQGVSVLVPAWWGRARPVARLHLGAGESSGLFGTESLVDFSWDVAIGDATLSPEEFERLVALRVPLARLGGQWVALGVGQGEALVRRWRQLTEAPRGRVAPGRALLLGLQAEAEAAGEDASPVLADAAVRALLTGLRGAPAEMPEPAGFQGSLRPYQRRGLAWLHVRAGLGLGGVLADDMGLGKTIQVLALIARRRQDGVRHPTLVVAPTSVVANWAAEAERFTPDLRAVVHHGPERVRGAGVAAAAAAADVVFTSYPLLLRDGAALAGAEWDGVILDEAQFVKNASAKQAQAARTLTARYRFALTGTPVENALSDLWAIFAFVQPGYLGSAEAFRRRLARPIEHGGSPEAESTLRRLIAPLVLRRTKAEPGVADELPEKVESLQRCHLSREQGALYEAVARELLERVTASTGMARRAAILLTLLRLKQVCNHPAHYAGDGSALPGRSGKLERLEELLGEVVAEGQRALVFTQFATWGRRLAGHLGQHLRCPVWTLDGSTPATERQRCVAEFQRGEGPGVFVLSLKAGGAGLNLTAARHVFHYDRWWNPAVERQATDRAYRIGQTASVQVHALLCVGTLEERIDQLLRRKAALADGVLGAQGEGWITELGDEELREVVTLRRAALG